MDSKPQANSAKNDAIEVTHEKHKGKFSIAYGLFIPIILAAMGLINANKHSVTSQPVTTTPPMPASVEIEGAWDVSKAEKLVLPRVQQQQKINPTLFEEHCCGRYVEEHKAVFTNRLLGDSDLIYSNREAVIVAVVSSDGSTCHACAPIVSLFEFDKQGTGWKLSDSEIGVIQTGQWGDKDAQLNSAFPLGNNIYGVEFSYGETHQGYTEGFTSIFAKIGDHFQEVFNEQTDADYHDKDQDINWNSTIKKLPEPVGFYSLLVKRSGKGLERSKKTLYKFDGQKYTAIDEHDPYQP